MQIIVSILLPAGCPAQLGLPHLLVRNGICALPHELLYILYPHLIVQFLEDTRPLLQPIQYILFNPRKLDALHQVLECSELFIRLDEEGLLVFTTTESQQGALLVACAESEPGSLLLCGKHSFDPTLVLAQLVALKLEATSERSERVSMLMYSI